MTHVRRFLVRGVMRFIRRVQKAERRWWEEEQKRKFLHCGEGVRLNGRSFFSGCNRIWIGNNVHIGDGAYIRGEGGLFIGDNTHISRNCSIYTMNHNIHGRRLPYDETYIYKPVRIGSNVWIGRNVCIAPGSVIAEGAVIGMGSVVAGYVEPLAIVVPQKIRVVGYRERGHYEELKAKGAFGGVSGRPVEWS